jgi:hypothetical protein
VPSDEVDLGTELDFKMPVTHEVLEAGDTEIVSRSALCLAAAGIAYTTVSITPDSATDLIEDQKESAVPEVD